MPQDLKLVSKLRELTLETKEFKETRLFGGTAFMLNGNMCYGVFEDYLILRLSKELAFKLQDKDPNIKFMDITGKVMKSIVMVSKKTYSNSTRLKELLNIAQGFVKSLDPK